MALFGWIAGAAMVGVVVGVGGSVAVSPEDGPVAGTPGRNTPAYWAEVYATAQRHVKARTGSYAPAPGQPGTGPGATSAPSTGP